ncbi:gamma-glutamyltransferase family protein [Pelagibius sp.]|uniref:gamma-glutamyltransferase family protein n=1 Tax=Pelagibius sp. TaxID=1931238 RepID=UPI00260E9E5D|nr:gamma-glutamyltransferase family protein [Pelagibius sp.]
MTAFTTRPEIIGTFGVVTSTHWLASAVGMSVLEGGGNAFDAAVAAGFTLQVVEPHLNGPAGEVPIILHCAREDSVQVICGQGVAPAAATIEAFRDLDLDMVPGTGLLACTVPGAFDAWMLMLRDYGTMELGDLLAPAIAYAEQGYPVLPNVSAAIDNVQEVFETDWPTSAALYLANGVPEAGSLFRNPVMAQTYRRIVKEAEAGGRSREDRIEAARWAWSRGFVAEAIDGFCRETEVMDVCGGPHPALLTGDDLANWSATKEPPLCGDYRDYTLCKTGPWGQGPVALQSLALLKGFDLDDLSPEHPDFVHLVVECHKLAFADREAFYGDPAFAAVPIETLISASYANERRALVGEEASFELRPGTIPGFGAEPIVRIASEESAAGLGQGGGEPTMAKLPEREAEVADTALGDTCHLDVIDRWGNMVSATPSGGWLQSSPAIPELGFCLNTRAQMFWLDERMPSSLEPGKRPRTTLSPSFALRDGRPYMAFGTPGGDQQDQWSLQVFLRHVHFGLNLQEAIDAPEFNSLHFPSSFHPRECEPGKVKLEGRFPEATQEELRRRGHDLQVEEDWSLGRVTAAAKDGDVLKAAANPRFMQGYAAGR